MPFAKEFDDTYKLGIKEACEDAGAYCERVDEQIFTERILDKIYNQIAKADIIISDMSNRNPNVLYETGYAHALNKQVIHLTHKVEDIPFDLTHFPHIVYESSNISTLKREITKRVTWLLEIPHNSIDKVDFNLKLLINDKNLSGNPVIPVSSDLFELKIQIHNQTNHVHRLSRWRFRLLTPLSAEYVVNDNKFLERLECIKTEGGALFSLEDIKQDILPDEWQQHNYSAVFTFPDTATPKDFDCALKVYSDIGPKDYPFVIRFEPFEFE